jgi:Tol biopolymer transport system component
MSRILSAVLFAALTAVAAAQERIADIRQGTNVSVALTPTGTTLIVDLLGQLWSLPATGGGAIPLTQAGGHARNPRVSPDGERVVYQRRDGDDWDIWLLELATGEERPLTTSPSDEREPDFTRDGRAVVFASNRTGPYCLWSVTLADGVETQLTEENGTASYPTVSEHGLVAYVLARSGEWSIRVLGSDGVISVVHTSSSRLSAPTWRPGGGVLIFGEQDSAETSRLQMLLLTEPRVLKSLTGAEDLFASRAAWRSGAEFIYAADGQLWRRGIATPARDPVHLFAAAAVEVAAPPAALEAFDAPGQRTAIGVNGIARSPDGRRTAFTALGDLWVAERGEPRRLTDDAFVDLDPTFWPDGESLVFASERTGQFELWRLTLRDNRVTQLTFGALEPRHPAVRPDGNSIAYFERAGLEPAAATALKMLDWRRREDTTLADNVVEATGLAWSEDGRALAVRGRSADAVSPRDFRVEFRAEPAAIVADAPLEARPPVRWQAPAPPPDYVVEVGRLFDGVRATYHRHVDLHVRGGRITAVVPRGTLPPVGEVKDARDATVIPGLIDLHAHQSSLVGERLGRAWLAYGVTTVRELTATPAEAIERGEAWASGRTPGPRLVISGWGTPSDVAAPLRTYPGIAHGFAHSLQRQSREIAVPPWTPSAFPARLRTGIEAPSRELELSPGFTAYQDGFSQLIASDTIFVTGLAALAGLRGWPVPRPRTNGAFAALFTPTEQAAWERPDALGSILPALERTVGRLVRAGGHVGVGSDAPAVPYGLGVHLELALLARAGIANDQVLRIATAGGALALGLEREVGTLEAGKVADFVVIDGDPLVHIGDTLRIVAVATKGVWREHASLLAAP